MIRCHARVLAAALAAGPGAVQPGQPPAATPAHHAVPRLIAEASEAAPGGMVNLGVTFEIEPGWHLYWKGRNDSGLPISVTLSLPGGWGADPVLWPAPERNILPGNIVDHIYEHRVTLVIPVRVPASAAAGARAELSAHVEWMECERRCLLAEGDISLTLPVGAGVGAPSANAALFAEALARIPAPLPEHVAGLSLAWEGNVLRIEAPGAGYLGFYPAADGPALTDPGTNGESTTGTLKLGFEWPAAGPSGAGSGGARVRGVLEVRRAGAGPAFYTLDLAKGQTAGVPQPEAVRPGIR